MNITINHFQIEQAVKYTADRRQYAVKHNLKHLGNIGSIPKNVDQFSVMCELAAADYYGVTPIMNLGEYHSPDFVTYGYPIDVKASFGKPAFAVRPYSINKMPKQTLAMYCTGSYFYTPPETVTIDVIGVISHRRVTRQCYLDDFGQPQRDKAYKVYLNDLKPAEYFKNCCEVSGYYGGYSVN